MKEVTTRTFGLLIAYLVPGFASLFCFAFWLPTFQQLIESFMKSNSNVGAFLFVLLLALLIGLLLNAFRWVIYEKWLLRDCKIPEDYYKKLSKDDNLLAIHTTLDENFRYHQFYGNISLVIFAFWIELIFKGLLGIIDEVQKYYEVCTNLIILSLVILVIEIFVVCTAIASFKRYVRRSKAIMEGT